MRYFADKIVYDKYEPENTNVVWVQPTEEGAQIKAYIDGEWQLIGYDHDAYRKPASGIPESDLEESVRNAIDNAQHLNDKIDDEIERSEGVDASLDERLGIVEQLADISISGGDATIATASDFNNPTAAQKAYIPTVGAILDGADTTPTSGSGKLVTSSGVYNVINSLKSAGYVFAGVATPSTSPGTPTEKVFYIGGAGTYANFGTSVTVPVGSIGVFKYNGSWVKEQIALFAGIDDVPTANSNNLVKSGGVYEQLSQLESEVTVSEYVEISSRQEYIAGYATLQGVLQSIGGSVGYGFRYIPVSAGMTYKMAGTYYGSTGYGNIVFSASFPTTGGECVVITGNQTQGTPINVTYTAPSDGYLMIWNGVSYTFQFYELQKTLKTEVLSDEISDIKSSISYDEELVQVTNTSFLSGFVSNKNIALNIGTSVPYGFLYIPVIAGTRYRVTGTYRANSTGYGGIVFSENILESDDAVALMETATSDATFSITYEARLNGFLYAYSEDAVFSYYSPKQVVVLKDELFTDLPLKKIQLVGSLYQSLYIYKANHRIVNPASSNGSYVIPVLEGHKYLVRGRCVAYAAYSILGFSDSLVNDYTSGVVNLVTVDTNTSPYTYEYLYKAPKDGYLIAWSTTTVYGSQYYIDAFEVLDVQKEIYDYYLPASLKIQTFGDSVTDNFWGDLSSWVNYIGNNINIASLSIVNSAVGGAAIAGSAEYNIPNQVINGYTREGGSVAPPLASDADVVVIFAGTNDWAGGHTIASSTGNLATAFQYIFEHSKAKVLFCTPLQRYNSVDQERPQNEFGEPLNGLNVTLREECDEFIKVCKRFSVQVLDLNADANINRFNILDYSLDGLHPHQGGDYYISWLICKKVKEMLRG